MSAESEVKRRIQKLGKITFAEFIEIALYWPHGGYYTDGEAVGTQGDYYTSPVAHPAFGALLAIQLFQMWQEMGAPEPFTVLELGAGNGLLCRDIITYAKEIPSKFAGAIRYICLDRRTTETLETGLPNTGRVLSDGLPFKRLEGCILSNEYLDAFPVHQIVMTNDGLKEVYISLEDDDLVEITSDLSAPDLAERIKDLGISLIEGQTVEINLSLDTWAQDVSAALKRGFVLTIDYGHIARDLYDSNIRVNGTLVTYHRHIQTDTPLTKVGRQDITAQVDFTSIMKSGEKVGLNALGLVTQREFLSNLGLATLQRRLKDEKISPKQVQTNRAGILDLARPGGLGDFKLLIQEKNITAPKLWGIEHSANVDPIVESLPIPLLTNRHLEMPDERFIGRDYGAEMFWSFPESETLG